MLTSNARILKLKNIQTDFPINIMPRGAPRNILWQNFTTQKNLLKKHFDAIFALVCAEKGLISSGFFHHRPHPSTGSEANTTRWHLMVWEENCAICPKIMLMMQTITKLTCGHYKEDNLKNGNYHKRGESNLTNGSRWPMLFVADTSNFATTLGIFNQTSSLF